jgi:hypothetical protein
LPNERSISLRASLPIRAPHGDPVICRCLHEQPGHGVVTPSYRRHAIPTLLRPSLRPKLLPL